MADRMRNLDDYRKTYNESVTDPEKFWAEKADFFVWRKKWDKVLEWNFEDPSIKWFINGKLNITENCLDRHLELRGNKLALIWEPNDPKEKFIRLTYKELHQKVCQFSNVLKNNGAKKGDRICIYMPMIPELVIAVLACARIGAIHSVVFAGFSAHALAGRIKDAQASMVITSDGMNRGAKQIPVKRLVDEALEECDSVRKVIIVERLGWSVNMVEGRDVRFEEEAQKVSNQCPVEVMDSEDVLFILYTSGSTGTPKGIVHTIGGYMVYVAYSFRNVFQHFESDTFYCTADVGWITGHSYLIYGPLLTGSTTIMFEGIPNYPDNSRFWQIIDKHGATHFYTAPTAIRSLMTGDIDDVLSYSLHSLKVLGSVGEPINEEAWNWYNIHIGKEKCPIVDTWWQTETGGILISPIAKITDTKPCHASYALPGVQPILLDNDGREITENNIEGNLCIKFPWPSMLRTIWGNHERCRKTYFEHFKGYYFTGDGAKRDTDGRYRIIGRVDDVLNVSGHRFGTAEIENAINTNEHVVESAVVGYHHEIKGQGIYAFVVCGDTNYQEDIVRDEVIESVVQQIGKIARPDKIQIVRGLPKTRSGKIMRRILRKIAENDAKDLGDISTLLDPDIVEEIKKSAIN
jgi:acetyl-CoA synthetase